MAKLSKTMGKSKTHKAKGAKEKNPKGATYSKIGKGKK